MPTQTQLDTRRNSLTATLRSLSAVHSDLDDTWKINTVQRGQTGYLEVLIDDEDGTVYIASMDTMRNVKFTMEYEATVPAAVVAASIVLCTKDA